jgi:hypothetical protein
MAAEFDHALACRIEMFVSRSNKVAAMFIDEVRRDVARMEIENGRRPESGDGGVAVPHCDRSSGDTCSACDGTGHSHHPVFGKDTIVICRECEGVIECSCGIEGCPWA